MARSRKSSQTGEEVVRRTVEGLRHPYPSKPGGGKFVLYCDTKKQDEDHPRVYIPIFAEAYAAARLVKVLMGNDSVDDIEECAIGTRTGIVTPSGVRITAFPENQVMELLLYEPTDAEAAWRDPVMENAALRLKLGSSWEMPAAPVVTEEVVDEETGELVTRKVKVKKGKKAREEGDAPAKERKPKIDRTGMVSAGDLAARLGIEPRIFRGALRSLKKIKPEGGWLWTAEEAEAVFKEVSKELGQDVSKDDKKKKKNK